MNPIKDRFRIDNFKEMLDHIERMGRPEHLPELENVVIREIAYLISEGTDTAKAELLKLEKMLDDMNVSPNNKLLLSALKNSIKGALSVAKFCLL